MRAPLYFSKMHMSISICCVVKSLVRTPSARLGARVSFALSELPVESEGCTIMSHGGGSLSNAVVVQCKVHCTAQLVIRKVKFGVKYLILIII